MEICEKLEKKWEKIININEVRIMKAAIYHKKEGSPVVTIEDRPKPEPKKGEVLVKMKYCGICGSDVASYKDKLYPFEGIILGHEMFGYIEELGPEVRKLKPGQRVAIGCLIYCGNCVQCKRGNDQLCSNLDEIGVFRDGGFTEYISVPVDNIFKIPDSIPDKYAAVMDPIATDILALRVGNFSFGNNAVIVGLGPLGQFLIPVLKYAGASKIIAVEKNLNRLEIAKKFNPDLAMDKISMKHIKNLTNRQGADFVFNCTAAPPVIDASLNVLRNGGHLLQIGMHHEPVMTNLLKLCYNNISIHGIMGCLRKDFQLAIDLVAEKIIDPEPIVTKIISLDDIVEEGFENLIDPETKDVKILVEP
jgi:(R,R)-butanediol dehydrogenase/meso-butanediol dehydrogenase/diacetyl reductase